MVRMEGKPVVEEIKKGLHARIEALKLKGVVPCLSVTLVGEDPSSQIYVNAKDKDAKELGIESRTFRLPATISQADLESHVRKLSSDPSVHGILVQSPLPKGLDEASVVECIDPRKDVDGFHPENLGRLMRGLPGHRACTPWGVMRMLDHYGRELEGKRAVVVGRSLLVGKPMGMMLLERNCTVTYCHSRTADLPAVCREADILVAAIGRPKMIGPAYVREGAVVIDVGINRTDAGMVGDVDFDAVAARCSAITPVPGGVGPMTRAILMSNTVSAADMLTA